MPQACRRDGTELDSAGWERAATAMVRGRSAFPGRDCGCRSWSEVAAGGGGINDEAVRGAELPVAASGLYKTQQYTGRRRGDPRPGAAASG
jgi:hypothetical protein